MNESKILIVEDDPDTSFMLRSYFEQQGYEVWTVTHGRIALKISSKKLPGVIILDIILPDIDGFEVCRRLRADLHTRHIPIIFLTQKGERDDRIAGLEIGGDDYITKPFSIEELNLRVKNALRQSRYRLSTDPVSGLPSGRLIEEQLRDLIRRSDWALLYIGITGFETYNEVYGFLTAKYVLSFISDALKDAISELGTPNDFIGHTGKDDFIVITAVDEAQAIKDEIVNRFDQVVNAFYSMDDQQRGYMAVEGRGGREQWAPFMSLAVGIVTNEDGPFADVHGITEMAGESRRRDERAIYNKVGEKAESDAQAQEPGANA